MENKNLLIPEITALMTTYNSAHHVKETIDSILNQSYSNFVFLILDDGSTDNTVEVIKSYQDKRIKLIEKKNNKGVGYRLMQGVDLIETPYIAKVDSDDISYKNRFQKQLNFLKENPELDIIKSLFNYFPDTPEVESSERYKQYKAVKEKEHNEINTPKLIAENLPRWSCVVHTAYFAKTKVIKRVKYPVSRFGEDYHLFLNALKQGFKLGCIKEYLVDIRISNYSVANNQSSPNHYLETLYNLKKTYIDELYRNHKVVWIYGTGGLAKETYFTLLKEGYKIAGFIDRTAKEPINIENNLIPIKSINDDILSGVIIAAQPVRYEISEILNKKGMVEWEDYIVLA